MGRGVEMLLDFCEFLALKISLHGFVKETSAGLHSYGWCFILPEKGILLHFPNRIFYLHFMPLLFNYI